jgi:UDP-glucose 4-epimerase
MNILVTGGAGYIGSHTCVELLQRGFGVVVVDNLSNSRTVALERVRQITGTAPVFVQADVRDRRDLDAVFERHGIDCVIHFAGFKSVSESIARPLDYYDDNLFSTIVLCETMLAHGITRLVFSSSATVYAPDNEMPLDETSRTGGCSNPYGWTKLMAERIFPMPPVPTPDAPSRSCAISIPSEPILQA